MKTHGITPPLDLRGSLSDEVRDPNLYIPLLHQINADGTLHCSTSLIGGEMNKW